MLPAGGVLVIGGGEMTESFDEKTIAIVPAHDEGAYIADIVYQIRTRYPYIDVVVIDDGSRDNTRSEALLAGAYVISNPFGLGYGGALQTGYKFAAKRGYDFLVQLDGDGQHDPACIEDLIAPVRKGIVDIAIGSRFLGSYTQGVDQAEEYHAPKVRMIGMKIFGAIASFLTKQKVTDPTSGYQAMNRKVVERFAGDSFPVDYPDADVIIMLHRMNFRLCEVPVKMYASPDRTSMHSGFRPIYYIFKMFLSIFVTMMRK